MFFYLLFFCFLFFFWGGGGGFGFRYFRAIITCGLQEPEEVERAEDVQG